MADHVGGFLSVGCNDAHEVVINHPDLRPDENGCGHIVFSPAQARSLAALLIKNAQEAEAEAVKAGRRRLEIYEPSGTRFYANGKEMMLVLNDEPRAYLHGWLLYRHPDGQWVTLRKATDDDTSRVCRAVAEAHHL